MYIHFNIVLSHDLKLVKSEPIYVTVKMRTEKRFTAGQLVCVQKRYFKLNFKLQHSNVFMRIVPNVYVCSRGRLPVSVNSGMIFCNAYGRLL